MRCRFYRCAVDPQIINVQNDADLNAISTSTDHTEDAIIIWVGYETIQLQFTSIRPLYHKLAAPYTVLSNCTIIVPSLVRNSAHSRTILMKIDDTSLSTRICTVTSLGVMSAFRNASAIFMVIAGLPFHVASVALVGHDATKCWNGQTIGGFRRGRHRYMHWSRHY